MRHNVMKTSNQSQAHLLIEKHIRGVPPGGLKKRKGESPNTLLSAQF